jgi:hypothetical protein
LGGTRSATFAPTSAGRDTERYRRYSEELVELKPDVILASASPSVAALQRITRSVPIVFANVVDPVGAGYVTSLAVRLEGANHQWRKIPPGELSINPGADERLGRVTGRAGAS